MRNYLKLRGIFWSFSANPPGVSGFLCAWGGAGKKDKVLLYWVLKREAEIRALFSNAVFVRSEPQVCYWLLDDTNFAVVLNGQNVEIAKQFYNGTHLPSPSPTGDNSFWGITRTKVEGSPRKTWSHGV